MQHWRDFLVPFYDFSNYYNLCNIYNNKFDFSLLGLNIREDNDRMKSYIGRNTAHILKTYKDKEIIQKILKKTRVKQHIIFSQCSSKFITNQPGSLLPRIKWISAGTTAADIQARVTEVHLAPCPLSDQGQGRILRKHFNNSTCKDWCSSRYIIMFFPSWRDPGSFILSADRKHPPFSALSVHFLGLLLSLWGGWPYHLLYWKHQRVS